MTLIRPQYGAFAQSEVHLLPLGQSATLVRFGDGQSANSMLALNFSGQLEVAALAGVVEIAPSLSSVQVRFDPALVSREGLNQALTALLNRDETGAKSQKPIRLWTIPACFGGEAGPQLAQAAALAGVREAEAIAEITAAPLQVMAIGFAPGQPYLGTLPPNWAMPRQSDLTPQVPAVALVVAIRQLVLFANPSPTGWRWIGSSAFLPFKADRSDPFALRPGDRIRFAACDASSIETLRRNQSDGLGGATCEVQQ
ncbi:MAG: carboxyltransferase domain-containing protein [Sphingomicrobium sp.]